MSTNVHCHQNKILDDYMINNLSKEYTFVKWKTDSLHSGVCQLLNKAQHSQYLQKWSLKFLRKPQNLSPVPSTHGFQP